MRCLIPCSKIRRTPLTVLAAAAFVCATATGGFAQHSGGHVGTAGHPGAIGHPSAGPVSHPVTARPIVPIHPPLVVPPTRSFLIRPPAPPAGSSPAFIIGYPYPHHPIPRRPFVPIAPYGPGFGVFGLPFFGLGWGFGYGFGPWYYGCGPYWSWDYGCYGAPYYQTSPGYMGPSIGQNPPPQMEVQNWNWPVYYYGEQNSEYVQLYLNDGTVYNVTDYWLVNGVLHYKMLEDGGTKVVEHTMDFSNLDLQKTIDVNTARGFRVVLRDEPIEQYLKDHPSMDELDSEPVQPGPMEPREATPQPQQ